MWGAYQGVQVGDFEGMGKGVYTTQYIPANTVVSSEEAVLILTNKHDIYTFCESYRALDPEARESLQALYCDENNRRAMDRMDYHKQFRDYYITRLNRGEITADQMEDNINEAKQAKAIWLTNSAQVDDRLSGLFPRFCRFNHACDFNVWWEPVFHESSGKHLMDVITRQDLQPGVQCCVNYIGDIPESAPWRERAEILGANWHFFCKCEKCETQREEEGLPSPIRKPNTIGTATILSESGQPSLLVPQTWSFKEIRSSPTPPSPPVHSIHIDPATPPRNPDPVTPTRNSSPSLSQSELDSSGSPRGDALMEFRMRGGSPKKSPPFKS